MAFTPKVTPLTYFISVSEAWAVPEGHNHDNALLVRWTLDLMDCQGGQFEITYRLIRRNACAEEPILHSEAHTVTSDDTSKEIHGLEGYSTYNITISVLGDDTSTITIVGSTSPARKYDKLCWLPSIAHILGVKKLLLFFIFNNFFFYYIHE